MAAVPPRGYGGTERVVSALTEELVRRGHEVTLFAAGGSVTSAELRAGSQQPLWEMEGTDQLGLRMLQAEDVIRHSRGFDVIHSHLDHLLWWFAPRVDTPVLTTLHGRLDTQAMRQILALHQSQPLVAISHAQRRSVAELDLNWVATVYHGLDLEHTYRLGGGEGGYLAFVGRISPEKDPVTAIRVAVRAGLPIKVAARVAPDDEAYFETFVVPLLGHPLVEWLGQVDEAEKADVLARARALLLPIAWDEPFGLSFIEALAAGTPVITRARGSTPELMRHGEHGFFAESEDEMVDACHRVLSVDRSACRQWALERFSVGRMADDYEAVFLSMAAEGSTTATAASG